MNAIVTGALGADRLVFADKALVYIAERDFDWPMLVINRCRIAAQYVALYAGLERAHIHCAVKANPASEIIRLLVENDPGFDAASRAEIELCLAQGAKPGLLPSAIPSKAPRTSPSHIPWALRSSRPTAKPSWKRLPAMHLVPGFICV